MSIDIEKLLALIARQPKIRTVEIADIIDCDPDHVQPALQVHIDDGRVLMHKVTAPNGRPANGFEMRPAALPPVAGVLPVHALMQGIDIDKAMTKTGRAIEFIRLNGSATNGQLHGVMRLKFGDSVCSFLTTPLRDGRLQRNGELWVIGAPVATVTKIPVIKPPKVELICAQPVGAIRVPDIDPLPAAAAMPEPAPIEWASDAPVMLPMAAPIKAPHVGPFRCAIWSDGAMELQRGGQTLALLTTIEQATLLQLMRQVAR